MLTQQKPPTNDPLEPFDIPEEPFVSIAAYKRFENPRRSHYNKDRVWDVNGYRAGNHHVAVQVYEGPWRY